MRNESAFPQPAVWDRSREQCNPAAAYGADPGMTLRDYFAAKMMAAVWANTAILKTAPSGAQADWVAALAYEQADAMLAIREEK